jgi:coenzyme F420-0:L-glutamate ligase/coenzyme F420-1:gamma-L-glutamate ligase
MPASRAANHSLSIELFSLPDFPHVQPGDDITALTLAALASAGTSLEDGDIVVIAQKIISKAEGRLINLNDVTPGERALEVATLTQKDPRLVELILGESDEISRMRPGVLIVRHRLGFTSANAGIDRSNVGPDQEEVVILLPEDPDGSAAGLRRAILERSGASVAVLIVDSHGRPFRLGTVGVAIGAAGLPALWNRRGERDLYGYELQHTEVGTADEIAAAASLLMGQAAEGLPVVVVRGLKLPESDGHAGDLVRPKGLDLYR